MYGAYISALQIENTSESDPRSYEAPKAVEKARKYSEASTGFQPMTSVILVQHSIN